MSHVNCPKLLSLIDIRFHLMKSSLYNVKIIFAIQMIKWQSQRQSLAQHFEQRTQSVTSYMLSSRASRKLREEVDQAAEEVQRFKQEIQKRYLLSVANKFYSFPYTQLSFDNPIQDAEMRDLTGKGIYCLYNLPQQQFPIDSVQKSRQRQMGENQSKVKEVLQQIKSERSKLAEILQLINNRRKTRNEDHDSRSKQKKLGYKYGIIKQQDQQLLRKRLYTQPNQKLAGFIKKKEK